MTTTSTKTVKRGLKTSTRTDRASFVPATQRLKKEKQLERTNQKQKYYFMILDMT